MIFDTHAHYDDAAFDADRETLLSSLQKNRIACVINATSDIASVDRSIGLAEKYDWIYTSVGIHPSELEGMNEAEFERLRSLLTHKKVAAVGEIGLDYYWEKDPVEQENQRTWFRRQLTLAEEGKLPVIIHSRDAAADTMQIMKEAAEKHIPGVIHCYSYSAEQALTYVAMGYYIGIGGVVTFKNARKLVETVTAVPMERLVLETDCPYLAPEPHRGERNSSLYLPLVVEKIAAIRGISVEEVEEITFRNAKELFHV